MKKEIAVKWVEALRSGKYQQGLGRLRVDDRYCCLGVLCDISGMMEWKHLPVTWGYSYDGNTEFLPCCVKRWAGLTLDSTSKLAKLNDNDGLPFAEIANVIEEEWEKL